jgi:hypothetical protein
MRERRLKIEDRNRDQRSWNYTVKKLNKETQNINKLKIVANSAASTRLCHIVAIFAVATGL